MCCTFAASSATRSGKPRTRSPGNKNEPVLPFRVRGRVSISLTVGSKTWTSPRQPALQPPLETRRQPRTVISVCSLPDCPCLRGIGMNDTRQGAQPDSQDDRKRNLVDHLPRVASDDGRAQYPVRTFFHVYLHKTLFF